MASSCGSHRPSYTKSCETWIGHKLGEAAAAPRRQAVDQCRPIARLHHKSQVAFWALLGCTARLALPCPPWVLYAPAAGLRSLCDSFECKMLAQLAEALPGCAVLGTFELQKRPRSVRAIQRCPAICTLTIEHLEYFSSAHHAVHDRLIVVAGTRSSTHGVHLPNRPSP